MTDGTHRTPRLGVALATALLVATAAIAAVPAAGAAQPPADLPAEPAVVVALDADGSARLTLAVAFDLATDRERQAFEALQANATAREQRTARFASRIRAIADRAESNTGRAMTVRDPAIAFVERTDTGIVALSVTWDGLAGRRGDALVVREPFSDGFDLDRRFTVVGPEGYELETVSPTPTDRSTTTATWAAGTSLEGFEATFVPTAASATAGPEDTEQPPTETTADAPGFGLAVAVVAVILGVLSVARRSRGRR